MDNSAIVLARFGADNPELLAEMLQITDARHFPAFFDAAKPLRLKVEPLLQAVIDQKPEVKAEDQAIVELCQRQANAATCLLRIGRARPGLANAPSSTRSNRPQLPDSRHGPARR